MTAKSRIFSMMLVVATSVLSSHNANASLKDLILSHIEKLLNREYKLSYTFKFTKESSEDEIETGLAQIHNDFTTITGEGGTLGLRLAFSPNTGVVKLDWERLTAAGVYTHPVYRCEWVYTPDLGWSQNCYWDQESCQVAAEADYTIFRVVGGQKIALQTLVNGTLSLASWAKQFIKDDKRVAFYDDVNELLGSTEVVDYEVYANVKKYTDWCFPNFQNHASSNSISLPPTPAMMQYADVNGDGHVDALYFDTLRSRQVRVSLSTGSGFTPLQPWVQHGDSTPDMIQYADVNGDGQADALYFDSLRSQCVWVSLSTGSGFTVPQSWVCHDDSMSAMILYRDVNGDGSTDALYFDTLRSKQVWVSLSTGSSFTPPQPWVQP